jgi:GTP-binding protein
MLNVFASAQFLASAAQLTQLPPPDRPEIAFAGRSNAGKSSALNVLCEHGGLARVSKTPGRTQLINFFEFPSGRLVDLPGYGFAQVPEEVRRDWGKLVTGFIQSRENLAGIVLIMDIRHPMTAFDQQMLSWATAEDLLCHVLLTKADKLSASAQRKTLKEVERALTGRATVQTFSSQSKAGAEEARRSLAEWLSGS